MATWHTATLVESNMVASDVKSLTFDVADCSGVVTFGDALPAIDWRLDWEEIDNGAVRIQ
jgi:hypothetical protein